MDSDSKLIFEFYCNKCKEETNKSEENYGAENPASAVTSGMKSPVSTTPATTTTDPMKKTALMSLLKAYNLPSQHLPKLQQTLDAYMQQALSTSEQEEETSEKEEKGGQMDLKTLSNLKQELDKKGEEFKKKGGENEEGFMSMPFRTSVPKDGEGSGGNTGSEPTPEFKFKLPANKTGENEEGGLVDKFMTPHPMGEYLNALSKSLKTAADKISQAYQYMGTPRPLGTYIGLGNNHTNNPVDSEEEDTAQQVAQTSQAVGGAADSLKNMVNSLGGENEEGVEMRVTPPELRQPEPNPSLRVTPPELRSGENEQPEQKKTLTPRDPGAGTAFSRGGKLGGGLRRA